MPLNRLINYRDIEEPVKSVPANYQDLKNIYASLDIETADYLHNDPWAVSKLNNEQIELESAEFSQHHIPNVKGMNVKDAVYLLENLGLKTEIKGRGLVRSQSIKAGSQIKKGQTINLQLAIY